MLKPVDAIIYPRWIITVDQASRVLENHALVIEQGKITAIDRVATIDAQYQSQQISHLPDHALIPGLINAHTHAAMSLMRGLSDDRPLMQWLNEVIWPVERQWVGQEFVHQGARLAVAEMIRCGTTCFNDMYFFPDVTAAVASAAGMRAMVGLIAIDFPSAWASDFQEYIAKGLAVHDRLLADELIYTAFAPHAPYSVADKALQHLGMLADELGIPIHIHLHETQEEIKNSMAHFHLRPWQRLAGLGLTTSSLQAVHMTDLNNSEIAALAKVGAHVVHCPQSNMKLASGFCPVQKLIDAGVNVALGTDGAASNNDLDMLAEMQSAAMLAKVVARDATAVSANTVLAMATIQGARALGIGDVTGSLETGKAADITAIDLGELETQPVYDPVSQIVYAADRRQVTHVWCHGKPLLKNRKLQTLDLVKLISDTQVWQEKIKAFNVDNQLID